MHRPHVVNARLRVCELPAQCQRPVGRCVDCLLRVLIGWRVSCQRAISGLSADCQRVVCESPRLVSGLLRVSLSALRVQSTHDRRAIRELSADKLWSVSAPCWAPRRRASVMLTPTSFSVGSRMACLLRVQLHVPTDMPAGYQRTISGLSACCQRVACAHRGQLNGRWNGSLQVVSVLPAGHQRAISE